MRIFKVLRGIVGTSLLWGLAWTPFGLIVVLGFWADAQIRELDRLIPLPPLAIPLIAAASWGVVAGSLFSAALAVSERGRQAVERIRPTRVAILGASVGLAVGLMFPVGGLAISQFTSLLVGVGTAAYGATMASGMLRLGSRAADDRMLPVEPDPLAFPEQPGR